MSVTEIVMSSRLSLLVDLTSVLAREVDLDAFVSALCTRVAESLEADRATIWLVDGEQGDLVARVATLPELPELRQPRSRGIAGYVARTAESLRIDDASADPRFDNELDKVTGYTTRSMIAVPISAVAGGPVRGVLQVLNRHGGGAFTADDVAFVASLATQIARALELTTLRPTIASEPGLTFRGPFNRIVGKSLEIAKVYEKLSRVAKTDATVLLRGETGTGKGLFARAIHVNSLRQAKPFVVLDCTTLPRELAESELFGHERGAFTGADRKVIGRVEMAEGGTLFLDEIGELSMEVQAKLLRFLQERTFERVGGRTTLQGDVRIVAATHRDLERAVREGKFREDLYYRVRVVEIGIPSLRDRGQEEIRALAEHFLDVFAQRYSRPETRFSRAAMAALLEHSWPGNVRELEHWIESAVVLAEDGEIREAQFPASPRASARAIPVAATVVAPADELTLPLGLTLEEVERRYAEATVKACDGNKTDAAERLDIGRNTLQRLLK